MKDRPFFRCQVSRWVLGVLQASLTLSVLSCGAITGLTDSDEATFRQETMDSGARYTLAIPESYSRNRAAPLVLVLHYGGTVRPYYGREALEGIFEPGLRKLDAIMVAPDCTGDGWTDPQAEEDVMDILARVMSEFNIDTRRVLITGYSMGGIGTWYLAPRHPELFTAALVVSGSPPEEVLEGNWTTPLYVIHSRGDEVLPYAPTVAAVEALEARGVQVKLDLLVSLSHYQMDYFLGPIKESVPWIRAVWE